MPSASIVITTRNRRDELRRALHSAFSQDTPVEVIVTDDASEDGTGGMVAEEFSNAKLLRSEQCLGLIVQRNRAASAASGDIIFSMDDDAEFGSPDTVRQTLANFTDARIGAVAIPHIDTVPARVVNSPAPNDGKIWCVAAYTGTSHAVRRNLFLRLGGYREDLIHQGEESDYCLRMLAAGFVTRLGSAPLLQHHESPRRSFERMDFYGRRNDLFFAWRHAPATWLLPHLLGTTVHGMRDALTTRRWSHVRGMAAGWKGIVQGSLREPVPATVYRLFRLLRKKGPLPLDGIVDSLPPILPTLSATS